VLTSLDLRSLGGAEQDFMAISALEDLIGYLPGFSCSEFSEQIGDQSVFAVVYMFCHMAPPWDYFVQELIGHSCIFAAFCQLSQIILLAKHF
jgi:hypothetical protein